LFEALLGDIVVDVALQSHQEVARNRRKCDICHTQYVSLQRATHSCGSY
jgi:transcriptional regulator NrdR family protein